MSIPALLAQATTTTSPNPAADAIRSVTNLQDACGVDESWACRWIYDATGSRSWAGVADWVLAKPLAILVIVVSALVAGRVARWFIKRTMQRIASPQHPERLERLRRRTPGLLLRTDEWNLRTEARLQTLTAVFRSLATAFIWFVAVVWILEVIGVNLGPLIAGAGIVGIALGFGTQTMVKDFISGFFLIAEDQYGVGDTVDLGGDAKGTVELITLRVTRVRDVEGTVWHVPNGQLTRVANKSHEWARALIDVVVPYQVDLDEVTDLMLSVAGDVVEEPRWSADVLAAPDVWGVQELAADGIHVRMVIKTRPAAQFALLRVLRRRLKDAFEAGGVPFAYAGGPTEVVLRAADEAPADEGASAASPALPAASEGAGAEPHPGPTESNDL